MARRRRKGNPLLTKILLVSVVAHIIALPIAAHYGAFKNVGRPRGESHIVMLTNNPKESPERAEEKAKEKAKKTTSRTSESKSQTSAKSNNNLPQPKVVTGAPVGDGGQGAATAESGTGKAGQVPEGTKTDQKQETEAKTEPKKELPSDVQPEKKPDTTKQPDPKPEPPKPPVSKPKKIIEATVIEAPEPEIPDELRSEPLDKTLIVEAQIDSGGHPTDVHIANSTGIKELDRIGLETAKKYRFKPATIDGVSTDQRVRFRINFKVE